MRAVAVLMVPDTPVTPLPHVTKGTASIQKLVDKLLLPPCLAPVGAQALVTAAGALGGQYSDQISCQ